MNVRTLYIQTSWACYRIGGRPEGEMHRALGEPDYVKSCLYCCVAYVTSRPNSRYCSSACSRAGERVNWRRRRVIEARA